MWLKLHSGQSFLNYVVGLKGLGNIVKEERHLPENLNMH